MACKGVSGSSRVPRYSRQSTRKVKSTVNKRFTRTERRWHRKGIQRQKRQMDDYFSKNPR